MASLTKLAITVENLPGRFAQKKEMGCGRVWWWGEENFRAYSHFLTHISHLLTFGKGGTLRGMPHSNKQDSGNRPKISISLVKTTSSSLTWQISAILRGHEACLNQYSGKLVARTKWIVYKWRFRQKTCVLLSRSSAHQVHSFRYIFVMLCASKARRTHTYKIKALLYLKPRCLAPVKTET